MRYIVTHKQNRAMRRKAARLAKLPMVRYVHENNLFDTDSYKIHNPNLVFEDEELHIDEELKENLDKLIEIKK